MLLPTYSSLLLGLAFLRDVGAVPQSNPRGLQTSSRARSGHGDVKRDEGQDVAPRVDVGDGFTIGRSPANQPHVVEKRFLDIIGLVTGAVDGLAAAWNAGLLVLVDIVIGGAPVLNEFATIEAATQGVFSTWSQEFTATSGFRSRSESGAPIYGTITRPESNSLAPNGKPHRYWSRLEAHVPLQNTTLQRAAMNANNGTDFIHIATTYRNGSAQHTIHYRRAHPDDLGRPNNGTYHQVRVMPAGSSDAAKRAEDDVNGVVMDYLWQQGDETLWDDTYYDTHTFDQTAASDITTWMEQNQAEATCATVIIESNGPPSEQPWGGAEDSGVLAFGWNNKPFGFNGRAGGWIDECVWD